MVGPSAATTPWPHDYPGGKIRSAIEGAIQRFEREIATIPDEASNYAHAAEWYVALWCYGFCTRADSFARAAQLVSQATDLNAECALAHTMQGVLDMGNWNWALAERSFRTAIDLDATSPTAHHWHALFLSARNKHSEAIAQIRKGGKAGTEYR